MDKTLLKGLQVLEQVAHADGVVRIADIVKARSLTKSNAHRILKTLEQAGYLRQDPQTKGFTANLKLWELGAEVVNRLDLRSRASDALHNLANETREAVHLSILDGDEVIYVDKIDSPEPVGTYTRMGGRAPAYCVATGKALLSQLPRAALEPILAELRPYSEHTITDPALLLEELQEARRKGFAINRGEWRSSVWGIAAVIHDATQSVIAAVGVSGPSYRLNDEKRCEVLAAKVMGYADEISRNLGYRGPGK